MSKVMIEMEMPKSCVKCPLLVVVSNAAICPIISSCITDKRLGEQKHPACPLQEVKE